MRRYATAFLDAKEIGGMDKILYAHVRGKARQKVLLEITSELILT